MKQILQSLKTGTPELAEVPCPAPRRGQLLIRTARSLVSAGTERMLLEFGKALRRVLGCQSGKRIHRSGASTTRGGRFFSAHTILVPTTFDTMLRSCADAAHHGYMVIRRTSP